MSHDILIVDDNGARVQALRRAFEAGESRAALLTADSLRAYRAAVAAAPPGAAILNLMLADGSAMDVLAAEPERGFPILVMVAPGDERSAQEALRAGALDCITTSANGLAEAPHKIDRALREWRRREDKRQATEASVGSEPDLRLLIENLNDVICQTDLTGRIGYMSAVVERVLGYSVAEVVGQNVGSFIHPDDRGRLDAAFRSVAEGRLAPGEYRVRAKGGDYRWMRTSSRPVLRDGEVAGFTGIFTDVTEQRQADAALRESEERYRLLVQNAYDAVMVLEISDEGPGVLLEVNEQACRMLGYTQAELLRMSIADIDVPEQRERLPGIMEALKSTGRASFETEHRGKGGRRIPVEVNARLFDLHGRRTVLSVVRDISERKRAEEQVEVLRRSIDAHFDSAFWYDNQNRFVYVNDAACSSLGYSREQLLGMTVADINPRAPAARMEQVWAQLRELGWFFAESSHRRSDGTEIPVEIATTYVVFGGREYACGFARDITERRRAERALRESETLLIESQRVARLGHYDLDVASGTWSSSQVLDEVFGIDARFARDVQGWIHLVHPDDRERMLAYLTDSVIRDGRPFDAEYRIRRISDGAERWVHGLGEVELDASGRAVRMFGVIQDVTERRGTELALQEKSRELEAFFNSALELLCIADADGRFRRLNREWERVLGYRREELEGQRLVDLVHPDDLPATLAALGDLTAQKEVFDLTNRYLCRDGSYRSIEWRAIPVGDVVYAAARDVTERRRFEEALRLSEEKFSKAFRDAPIWISIATVTDGTYLEINDQALRISGFSREELIGRRAVDTGWISAENRRKLLAVLERDGRIHDLELTFHAKDGREIIGLVHGERIVVDGQDCILATTVDVTGLRRAEAERLGLERQLLHAQKLESLGVLAGGIAHDFNNLLMGIQGSLELATRSLPPAGAVATAIEQAAQAARRATDLTRQMLAYSGKGRFEITRIDLNALVEENAGLFRSAVARSATLNVVLSELEPAIDADAGQAQQVVMNLITNAAEALGGRPGVVTLATGLVECDASYLAASRVSERARPGRYAYVEVSDTGCGMDRETLDRLFDPFFTSKFTGRGLGMSVVLGIVRGHKGAILIDSAPGRGSVVRVLLPAAEARVSWDSAVREAGPSPRAVVPRGLVLLVDDEDVVRAPCRGYLQHRGFAVLEAESGPVALELLQGRPHEIACVILDLTMPGMGGAAVFKEILRIRADLPVILASGFAEGAALQDFGETRPAGFLQKPFRLEALVKAIERVLDAERGEWRRS
jgi:two-component system, cell cycle sensor histidine kinase and response regulator CckA